MKEILVTDFIATLTDLDIGQTAKDLEQLAQQAVYGALFNEKGMNSVMREGTTIAFGSQKNVPQGQAKLTFVADTQADFGFDKETGEMIK